MGARISAKLLADDLGLKRIDTQMEWTGTPDASLNEPEASIMQGGVA